MGRWKIRWEVSLRIALGRSPKNFPFMNIHGFIPRRCFLIPPAACILLLLLLPQSLQVPEPQFHPPGSLFLSHPSTAGGAVSQDIDAVSGTFLHIENRDPWPFSTSILSAYDSFLKPFILSGMMLRRSLPLFFPL